MSSRALERRIHDAAVESRRYAPVPRVAFYDIAYPKDCAELAAMNGYGVLVVTALAQDSSELPPSQLYTTLGTTHPSLSKIAGAQSRVLDITIAQTFGIFRYDGFYLLPLEASHAAADLLLDFALHRREFRLGHLSGVPKFLRSCSVAPSQAEVPPHSVVSSLVAREYPGLAQALNVQP